MGIEDTDATIRDCCVEDIERVLSIWETSGAGRTPTDNVHDVKRAIAEPQLEFLVAEVDGRVVGTIMGGFDGWRGAISRLAVEASYRRRGIGQALLAEVEERFDRNGVSVVTALVEKDHPWAMAYWDATDFTLDERFVLFTRRK